METNAPDWKTKQKILVCLAHPDDPEFFLGATIARWVKEGHWVGYFILTNGDKGYPDPDASSEVISAIREKEQKAAAAVLGVKDIIFHGSPDGLLVPTLEIRREVVRQIRFFKPTILVGCDPTNYFPNENYINHPDHRAAGQIVLDAVFPAAGNAHFFPELRKEGLEPHSVKEVWLSLTQQANTILDVTTEWETKIRALHEHYSQIADHDAFDVRMRSRQTEDSTEEAPRFEERFRRIIFQ